MPADRAFAIVAGGGTAGHVMPALSIAEAMAGMGHARSSILFVGSRRGLESRLVPEAGFPLVELPGRGVPRRVSPAAALAVAGLVLAAVRSVVLMARRRPRVLVTVGGYAGLPVACAAWLWRVPVIVAESNAVAGASNRIAARFARACAVAFPGTGLRRSLVTGNPVRPDISAVGDDPGARVRARAALSLPAGRFVVLAFGGSLGSRTINESVVAMARILGDRGDIAIRHVLGRRDWPGRVSALDAVGAREGGLVYQPIEYEDAMPAALAAADLVIARAGATTVAEVSAAGRASVLVPLPGSPGDHQSANAAALEKASAAIVVSDALCTGATLAATVAELSADRARTEAMGDAARGCARPGAATAIAALAEKWALPRGPR